MKLFLNAISLIIALGSIGGLITEQLAEQSIQSGSAIPAPSIAVPLVAVAVLAILLTIAWFIGELAYKPRVCPTARYSQRSNEGRSTREAA